MADDRERGKVLQFRCASLIQISVFSLTSLVTVCICHARGGLHRGAMIQCRPCVTVENSAQPRNYLGEIGCCALLPGPSRKERSPLEYYGREKPGLPED
jgi:hypothetical protein